MKSYYSNYIVLDEEKTRSISGKTIREIYCFFEGEKIGRLNWKKDRSPWEKSWEAEIITEEYRFGKHFGWYSTITEAKVGLLQYAKDRAKKEKEKKAPVAYLPSADREFYPTPEKVAGALLAGVKWDNVNSILEPSAGKGDMLGYAKRVKIGKNYQGFQTRIADRNLDIDCIEIDENLRFILKGKGYRVVHDDFLTFQTRKQYDLILMNPPFSNGEYHLLHALELCENGGEIACVLNAETLLNPYTKARAALVKELRKVNADIRYLKNGFSKAERSTDVEVALVNVHIPASFVDPTLFENLKKAEQNDENVVYEKDEIAPANNVDRLIREYDLLCRVGIDLIRKYNGVRPYLMNGTDRYSKPLIELEICGHTPLDACGTNEINNFLKRARGIYWRKLFDLPMLRGKMTSEMNDEYSSTIDEMRDYEFSFFNIQQVLDRIREQLGQGVEIAIMKCFDKLSNEHAYHEDLMNENIHYYNGWKTNKAHLVNMKCIIPTWGCFATEMKKDKYDRYKEFMTDIDPHGCFSVLSDLEKALDYLDKGETFPCNLSRSLEIAAYNGKTTVQCKYFDVTFYKKGTCHIKFRDQKIVDRLNIFAGRNRNWLPPTYGKVRYQDMDDESRRVVDEFMGKEHYEAVMDQPNEYLIDSSSMVPLLEAAQ